MCAELYSGSNGGKADKTSIITLISLVLDLSTLISEGDMTKMTGKMRIFGNINSILAPR